MRLERTESRKRWREMTDMVTHWDPVGLAAAGAPSDEYDCVVGDVLRALERGDSAAELAHYLTAEISDHFGSSPHGATAFAEQASAWYKTNWPGTTV